MRSHTCSISSLVAWGRMEMIMMVTVLYKNKNPLFRVGWHFRIRSIPTPLPGGAKAPKPEAVKVGIKTTHRNDKYIEPEPGKSRRSNPANPGGKSLGSAACAQATTPRPSIQSQRRPVFRPPRSSRLTFPANKRLQRAQEIENVLLLRRGERVEGGGNSVGFR